MIITIIIITVAVNAILIFIISLKPMQIRSLVIKVWQ